MSDYARTAIRSLSIRGFRSIRSLDLTDIPDLVVLHGPNGSGKSNLLRAAQLALRAAIMPGELPLTRKKATSLSLLEADKLFDLRPDDFHIGVLPEIRVSVAIDLGNAAAAVVGPAGEIPLRRLNLDLVVQQTAEGELRYWFEKADIDGVLGLSGDEDPKTKQLVQALTNARKREEDQRVRMLALDTEFESLLAQPGSRPTSVQRVQLRAQMQTARRNADAYAERARQLEAQLGPQAFVAERIRNTLLPKLLQVSPAYRVPGGQDDPETALFQAFLSENPFEREATKRLGRRLAKARLFGMSDDRVALLPIESGTYKEKQVRFAHPTGGELPLRNLGSGEQQVIFMLAQRVITPYPIALLEEPEAHLHPSLMAPFAQVLLDSLAGDDGTPDVEQLWIATHHHHFALALEYFDVTLVDGATQVTRQPRAKAARHFFEPGPIWEALRQLASSAKQREAVVFRAPDGSAVTAGEILDSIEKDPTQRIAKEYAQAVTETMVQAMRQRAEKAVDGK